MSTSFWDRDVTANISASSAANEVVKKDVNREGSYFPDMPMIRGVALTVTWLTGKNGAVGVAYGGAGGGSSVSD